MAGATMVAPSRGRGLKPRSPGRTASALGRPFAGAWIETFPRCVRPYAADGRPFAGAWIETARDLAVARDIRVAPSRGRGLKLTV